MKTALQKHLNFHEREKESSRLDTYSYWPTVSQLINAQTGEVELAQKHFFGNATNQELADSLGRAGKSGGQSLAVR
jgi:hypothetical protein